MADSLTAFRAGDRVNAGLDTGVIQGGIVNTEDANVEPDLLDVADLCRMFEDAEEATQRSREESERDRDYYDSKQLTADELAALEKRKQPPMIDNRIKTKIDYLIGLEKQQRINPKALPRTPQHEEDADAASQALRYVADDQDFDTLRSEVWRNLLIEGCGGISVSVEPSYSAGGAYGGAGDVDIILRVIPWDRMFFDPHSAKPDFSDATYKGIVQWMDYDEARRRWPESHDELEYTLAQAALSDTYDDKPKFSVWADKKRKRVRICQVWIYKNEEWHFAEFTKGGILRAGPSPYKDDQGKSDCEFFFQSAYVNRDNERYGLVREMVTLQDGINKRQSKALHLLNTTQVIYEDGMLEDVEAFRREANRPDGVMKVAPGGLENGKIKIETRVDLAAAQMEMLTDAKNSIDLKGPNATMMGDKAQGSAAASGRAILASQQGGMVQLGDLLDNLRNLDKRVFRAIWNRIRQYWTAQKWVRVTDDERQIKWVGLNVDPAMVEMAAAQNPQMAQSIAGVVGSVAELDCDIIIDEAPDSIAPALEQWQGLVELVKGGIPIPPDVLIEAAPNIKNKGKLLEKMKEAQQNAPPPPEVAAAQAKLQIEQQAAQQDAQLSQVKAQADVQLAEMKAGADAASKQQMAQIDAQVSQQKAQSEIELKWQIAQAEIALEKMKLEAQLEIERTKAEAGIEIDRSKAESAAKIAEKKAKQQPKREDA